MDIKWRISNEIIDVMRYREDNAYITITTLSTTRQRTQDLVDVVHYRYDIFYIVISAMSTT